MSTHRFVEIVGCESDGFDRNTWRRLNWRDFLFSRGGALTGARGCCFSLGGFVPGVMGVIPSSFPISVMVARYS